MKFPFKFGPRGVLVLVIILVVVLIFVGWTIVAYNGLVAKQTAVEAQWAQAENAMQLKIDKIPQLVDLAWSYAEFERSTLLNLTDLRTRWMNATQIPEQADLSNLIALTVADLRTTFENYPYLQSETLLVGAFDEIAEAENMIAVERGRYNNAVRTYNTSVRSFPDSIVAGWFGFPESPYFDPIPGGP